MAGEPSHSSARDVGEGTSAQGAVGSRTGSGAGSASNTPGQGGHPEDYYSRGFAQSAEDISTSSRSAGNTAASGNMGSDNQEMSALMRLMRAELSKQRADISDMMDEKIGMALEVAPQMKRTHADRERMKRQSYRNWADKYEAERQDEL